MILNFIYVAYFSEIKQRGYYAVKRKLIVIINKIFIKL